MGPKPLASLSLDLDNQWAYMKTAGVRGWDAYPSYLAVVVPRALGALKALGLRVTVFVVGRDAAADPHRELLGDLVSAGHEVGNHSFSHEPWFGRYSEARTEREIVDAEDAIAGATGQRPRGYRAPGYSLSAATLRVLSRRGYDYDASMLPTFIGPLARAYYFLNTPLSRAERRERAGLFGTFRDGLRPIRPFRWNVGDRGLLEVPVTTMPIIRTPMHLSYLLYMSAVSPGLARGYLRASLALCRTTGTTPSLLLHSLDFLGCDDTPALSFFPTMNVPYDRKRRFLDGALQMIAERFSVVPLGEQARRLLTPPRALRRLEPQLPDAVG